MRQPPDRHTILSMSALRFGHTPHGNEATSGQVWPSRISSPCATRGAWPGLAKGEDRSLLRYHTQRCHNTRASGPPSALTAFPEPAPRQTPSSALSGPAQSPDRLPDPPDRLSRADRSRSNEPRTRSLGESLGSSVGDDEVGVVVEDPGAIGRGCKDHPGVAVQESSHLHATVRYTPTRLV